MSHSEMTIDQLYDLSRHTVDRSELHWIANQLTELGAYEEASQVRTKANTVKKKGRHR